jgi:hypothetical protein
LLPLGSFDGESGRLLTTFLGFFTAGVLPTISILIGSISAGGRSVKALNGVYNETKEAISALLGLFVLAGSAVTVLFMISLAWAKVPVPLVDGTAANVLKIFVPVVPSPAGLSVDLSDIVMRIGQMFVCCLILEFIRRVLKLPAILDRALVGKHELALDEARRKLAENVPKEGDIKKRFGSSPEFGDVIRLDEKSK